MGYTLWWCQQLAIENGPVEIVDVFPSKNGGSFHSYVTVYQRVVHESSFYPLVNIQKAIENGPVEIVDLPIKHGGSFHSFLYVHQAGYVFFCGSELRQLQWPLRPLWRMKLLCHLAEMTDSSDLNRYLKVIVTLWWTYKKLWKITIFNGKIHYFYDHFQLLC